MEWKQKEKVEIEKRESKGEKEKVQRECIVMKLTEKQKAKWNEKVEREWD